MNDYNEHEIKSPEVQSSAKTNNLSIPIAIVIAGVLIAGAVYMGSGRTGTTNNPQAQVASEQQSGNLEQMMPVTSEDHIRGNPNASVKIVEYSDMECPFCRGF